MPVPSLHHLARRACIKNIRSITDVGDIPYDILRPILLKLENPEQLRELEKVSPQLRGNDAELWREFIKRDIEGWEKKIMEPNNTRYCYKVYARLREETQNQVEEDARILQAAMENIKNERAKHTSRMVDPKTLPKLPRMGGMRAEGGRSKTVHSHTSNPSVLSFASGSKTKTLTGRGVLEKARREARELSLFSAKKSLLATPTHKLNGKATQIRNVPQGLVDEHRRAPAPSYLSSISRPTTIIAPRKRHVTGEPKGQSTAAIEEREGRLKALTAAESSKEAHPQGPPTSHLLSATSPSANSSVPARTMSSSTAFKARPVSPRNGGVRPPAKTKAAVDPFMPVKRRKIT